MHSKKKLKPYRQGDLDCFCGLYSLVNAVRYLELLPSVRHAVTLMDQLSAHIEPTCSLQIRLTDGMDSDEIVSLLKRIIEPQYHIRRSRPFYRTSARTTMATYVRTAKRFLSSRRGIILVSLDGYHEHWTLISRVTSTSFIFYDSNELRQVAFRNCGLHDRDIAKWKKGRVHILSPYDTHFLWVD